MRDFELNRSVDALGIAATNSKSEGPTPQALYVPVFAYPVIVAAYAYLVAATQVGLGAAYWVGAGYWAGIGYQKYIY
jgi:hypothetical protein